MADYWDGGNGPSAAAPAAAPAPAAPAGGEAMDEILVGYPHLSTPLGIIPFHLQELRRFYDLV